MGGFMKCMRLLCVPMLLAGVLAAGGLPRTVGAQEIKVLFENEKVRAFETRYKPGEENENVPRDGRIIRALTSGTLLRTYADGKTEKVEWKAGDVRFNPPITGPVPQYTTKNVGGTELALYVVVLK
jgi:hypothetical protein